MKDRFIGLLVFSAAAHAAVLATSHTAPPRVDLCSSLLNVDVVFDAADPINVETPPPPPPAREPEHLPVAPPPPIPKPEPAVLEVRPVAPPATAELAKVEPVAEPASVQEQALPVVPLEEVAVPATEPATLAPGPSSQVAAVSVSFVDSPPVALSENAPPIYPLAARRARYEGTVVLDIEVAASGAVVAVRLNKSSGHAVLDREAVRAVGQWQFAPATTKALAVACRITVPVRFVLGE